jgi:hypothetical protein
LEWWFLFGRFSICFTFIGELFVIIISEFVAFQQFFFIQ